MKTKKCKQCGKKYNSKDVLPGVKATKKHRDDIFNRSKICHTCAGKIKDKTIGSIIW